MDHAEAAEVAILRAEWPIDNRYLFDQLRTERFERSQIALAVALRTLVLLNVVHQHLQPAVDPTVVQVEPKSPDLKRLAAALVLTSINTGIELLQDLIIAREERAVKHLRIPEVNGRLE